MPAGCLKEAKGWIEGVEAEGYVGGLTPKIWGQYVERALGKEGGEAYDAFVEGMGQFSLSKPMGLRDIVLVTMWVWRKVFPEMEMLEGCQRGIRVCIQDIVKSPGFGILLKVLDQGFVEVTQISEAIAAALTTFTAKVEPLERGLVQITFYNVSNQFMRVGIEGYFMGLMDMCREQGEIKFESLGAREGRLKMRYGVR